MGEHGNRHPGIGRRLAIGGRCAACCLLASAVLATPGCNIIAPAYYLVHGPEKIPAEFKLDPKRPTVVFIDDPSNRVPRRQLRAVLGQTIDDILLKKKLVRADDKETDLISSAAALTVASKDKSGTPMSITQIGKAVGAEVVVWIVVDQFTLSPDGQSMSPTVAVRMKVIDTAADKRVWPDDPGGKVFRFLYPSASPNLPASSSARAQAEMDLANYAARGISELFYEVERPTAVRAGHK